MIDALYDMCRQPFRFILYTRTRRNQPIARPSESIKINIKVNRQKRKRTKALEAWARWECFKPSSKLRELKDSARSSWLCRNFRLPRDCERLRLQSLSCVCQHSYSVVTHSAFCHRNSVSNLDTATIQESLCQRYWFYENAETLRKIFLLISKPERIICRIIPSIVCTNVLTISKFGKR